MTLSYARFNLFNFAARVGGRANPTDSAEGRGDFAAAFIVFDEQPPLELPALEQERYGFGLSESERLYQHVVSACTGWMRRRKDEWEEEKAQHDAKAGAENAAEEEYRNRAPGGLHRGCRI
jgi:hypothetical protein